MRTNRRVRLALLGAVAAGVVVAAGGCTASSAGRGSGSRGAGASGSNPGASISIVGTSTVTSTLYTTDTTFTAPPSSTDGADGTDGTGSSPAASTGSGATNGSATLPAAQPGECPYLAASDVMAINGQHVGPTSIISVKPYPICIFTRSDGSYQATTRIVVAATPAAAVAAVNAAAPVDESFPVDHPAGWSGGAMSLPNGNADNPLNRSVYAVSKGKIAIIAESNQGQSIKGRQIVEQIVQNQGW